MKEPTKVQQTIPLAEVPSWVLRQVEDRALKALKEAQEELNHLITRERKESEPDPEALVYHIEQCRIRLADTDVALQDAHLIIAGYIEHFENKELATLKENTERLQQMTSALENAAPYLPKQKAEENEQ